MSWQPGRTLDDIEKETILMALSFYGNNKTATANSLNISLRTLVRKLEIYSGITPPPEEGEEHHEEETRNKPVMAEVSHRKKSKG